MKCGAAREPCCATGQDFPSRSHRIFVCFFRWHFTFIAGSWRCGIPSDSTTPRTDPSEDVTFDNRPLEDLGQTFILGDGCSDRVTAYTYCAPPINAFMVITIICPEMWIKCRHERCSQPLQMFRDKTFLTGSSLDKLFLDSTFASLILHEMSHARVIHPGTGGDRDGTGKEP